MTMYLNRNSLSFLVILFMVVMFSRHSKDMSMGLMKLLAIPNMAKLSTMILADGEDRLTTLELVNVAKIFIRFMSLLLTAHGLPPIGAINCPVIVLRHGIVQSMRVLTVTEAHDDQSANLDTASGIIGQ